MDTHNHLFDILDNNNNNNENKKLNPKSEIRCKEMDTFVCTKRNKII